MRMSCAVSRTSLRIDLGLEGRMRLVKGAGSSGEVPAVGRALTPPSHSTYPYKKYGGAMLSTRGLRLELKTLIKQFFRNGADTRFLLFGRGRSGTTLLVNLLDEVPGVTCDGEVLHYPVVHPLSHLRRLARSSRTPVWGCKLLTYQILEVNRTRRPLRLFQRLVDEGVRLIHLERSTFGMTISHCVAEETSSFVNFKSDEKRVGGLELDPKKVLWHLKRCLLHLEYEREIVAQFDHLELNYEEDLANEENHQRTVDGVCKFLGVDGVPIAARTEKVIGGAGLYVSNLENIKQFVIDAGYERAMLPRG